MFPNPYMMSKTSSIGLLSKGLNTLKSINWGSLLEGTQKTLGVINQAIPVVYQIKPIVNNARTIFKIAGSMKEDSTSTPVQEIKTEPSLAEEKTKNLPIFYI